MSKTVKKKLKEPTAEKQLKLLLTPCKNKKELQAWIKYFLNLDMPDTTVSRHADTNPLDIIWEMYSICVLKQNPDNIQELLYTASRGSGKTLSAAIAEFMIILHDQRDIAHVGAIMAQAKRAYEYIQGFCLAPRVKPLIDPPGVPEDKKILKKSTMEKSIFNINGNICTMEVLPTTMKALNGVHCAMVSCDELDTLSGEGLRAIKEVAGMLDTKKGKKPLKIGISTRKSRHGLMNRMIENADREGRHLRFWTALEFTEQCPDERSGTTPTDYYINVDAGETLSIEEYERKDQSKQKEFQLQTGMYDKCKVCPAAVFCRGDAKKQTSTSNMLKSIEELNQKIRSEGYDWAASQLFNLKPSSEGIVYKEFDEKTHVKNWNQMWSILTGQEYPGECTHDVFVKMCHQMKLSCYAGIDWGWSNPSTVVYFFVDNRENIYVVRCEGQTYLNNPTWAQTIKYKWHQMYRCQLYFPDLANPGDAVTMKTEGLPCPTEQIKDTDGGIQLVKKWLRSFSSPMPKMFFAKETCGPIILEFQMYHFKTDASGEITDDVEKEYDHWLDALRYAMYGILGKSQLVMGNSGYQDGSRKLVDDYGRFYSPPTAEEFAAARGIQVNIGVDTSKLGKIGKKSELEDDEGEQDTGSGGGFLWSF